MNKPPPSDTEGTYIEQFKMETFGFPLLLQNVKTFHDKESGQRRAWINLDQLRPQVIKALLLSEYAITGNQFHFIRVCLFDCSIKELAEELRVAVSVVEDWENTGNNRTAMSQSHEVIFRASALSITENDESQLERYVKWLMYNGEPFKAPESDSFELIPV